MIIVVLLQQIAIAQSIQPVSLTCEYVENPLGIDIATPRFSWVVESAERNQFQSAYELEVSGDEKGFGSAAAALWQTGKITASQNLHIEYKGPALQSFKRYYWRVKLYNQDGIASGWSQPAWFETAMLSGRDWTAKWISDDKHTKR